MENSSNHRPHKWLLCALSEHKRDDGRMYLKGVLGPVYIEVLSTQIFGQKGERTWGLMLSERYFDRHFDEGESTDVKPDAKLANKDSTNP